MVRNQTLRVELKRGDGSTRKTPEYKHQGKQIMKKIRKLGTTAFCKEPFPTGKMKRRRTHTHTWPILPAPLRPQT